MSEGRVPMHIRGGGRSIKSGGGGGGIGRSGSLSRPFALAERGEGRRGTTSPARYVLPFRHSLPSFSFGWVHVRYGKRLYRISWADRSPPPQSAVGPSLLSSSWVRKGKTSASDASLVHKIMAANPLPLPFLKRSSTRHYYAWCTGTYCLFIPTGTKKASTSF